jgi:hypothetical protein
LQLFRISKVLLSTKRLTMPQRNSQKPLPSSKILMVLNKGYSYSDLNDKIHI